MTYHKNTFLTQNLKTFFFKLQQALLQKTVKPSAPVACSTFQFSLALRAAFPQSGEKAYNKKKILLSFLS